MIALFLLGCMTEPEFQAQYDEAVCEWKAECEPDRVPDAVACEAEAAAAYTSPAASCAFDAEAAASCVAGVQELPCTSALDDEESIEFPAACADVWACP